MSTFVRFATTAFLVATAITLAEPASGGDHVVMDPTGVEAAARGRASLDLDDDSVRRFDVRVQRLAPNADYDLIVGGATVHTLRTNNGGRAKARFDSRPRGNRTLALAFEPRGKPVIVRAAGGDDVLTAMLPSPSTSTTSSTTTSMLPDTTTTIPPPEETTTTSTPQHTTTTVSQDTTTTLPATCSENCWSGFFACLDGCRTTYCAPYCQVDLGRCLDGCPP